MHPAARVRQNAMPTTGPRAEGVSSLRMGAPRSGVAAALTHPANLVPSSAASAVVVAVVVAVAVAMAPPPRTELLPRGSLLTAAKAARLSALKRLLLLLLLLLWRTGLRGASSRRPRRWSGSCA